MRRPGLLGACWPNPLQTEVLRAAVLDPAEAVAAWARIRPAIVLDDVWDEEVHRLLPLVHQNLVAAGVDDVDLPRLKGIRRRTWYDNQMRLHQVRPGLASLEDAGIELVFLKGVALGLAYYGDLGLRPMRDVDVLVRRDRAVEALDLLEAQGWHDAGDLTRDELFRAYHGSGLLHPDGGAIDVHWHLGTPLLLPSTAGVPAEVAEAASTEALFDASEAFSHPQQGLDGRILSPTDLLLHAIAHALWAGSNDTTRWAADSRTVIRTRGADIDWGRLVDEAQRRRIAPLVADGLRFVADELAAPIPSDAIATLDATPMRRSEQRHLRALTGPLEGSTRLGGLPHLRSYWAYTRLKWGPWQSMRELPSLVTRLWSLDSAWHIPAGALARARRAARDGQRDGERDANPKRPEPAPPTSVAVVVPTHHRPDDLRRCLDALARQQEPADQVIVVRGADDTAAAALVATHAVGALDVVAAGTTQVERMEAGAAVARAAIVAFTDDDAAPRPGWVAGIRRHLRDSSVGAIGGRDVQPGSTARPVTTVGTLGPGGRLVGGHSDGTGGSRDVDHLRGVNLAVRRDLLRLPGGLRGRGAQGYNELAICLAVKATGHRVVYDPELLVDHNLAPRPEYDGIDGRPAKPLEHCVDDTFNQSYILLSLRPRRRWSRLAYVVVVGDRSTGGALRSLVALVSGDRWLARQWWPLLQANLDADRAARTHPLELRAPGWSAPTSET